MFSGLIFDRFLCSKNKLLRLFIKKALEEHSVIISNMKSTRFVEPFEDLVNDWELKLSFVSEILEAILQAQKKWLYLENIFQGEDIQREMKEKVQHFFQLSSGRVYLIIIFVHL